MKCQDCGLTSQAEPSVQLHGKEVLCNDCHSRRKIKAAAIASGDPRYHAVLSELGQLHARKCADYGVSGDPFANIRASEQFGIAPWLGAVLRGNDKMKRLQAFAVNGSLKNESLEDSLLDLAAYAIIALVLFREEFPR